MPKDLSVLEFRNITKSFIGGYAVKDLSFVVKDKEFLTILGPSGCGKTTIIRLIAGFEKADKGQIIMQGHCINKIAPQNRSINTIFQNYALFPHMSVFDNIAFGLKVSYASSQFIKKEVEKIARKMGLSEVLLRMPYEISGGEQQRVAIARAILKKPSILLLDEPLSALDKNLRCNMQLELKKIQREFSIAFILVTHDQEEALSISDKIIVMDRARIKQIGTPREIYERPSCLFVAQFIGDINVLHATVISRDNQNLKLKIDGIDGYVVYQRENQYKTGEILKILLRPQDINIVLIEDQKNNRNLLVGQIKNVIYKGHSLDFIVCFSNNKEIRVNRFFNASSNDHRYNIGTYVLVTWKSRSEKIIRHE